jgi:hypothetical protein
MCIQKADGIRSMRAMTCRASGAWLIARGRDAADVAIITAFGPNTLESFQIITEEI